jgi:4-amino-4-deoxy-L-arabinose transferase-like glycosyltransferase
MGRRSREKKTRRVPPASGPRDARDRLPPRDVDREPEAPASWGEWWRLHRTPILTLFAIALAYRVAVLLEVARTPYLEVANVDSDSYQQWALDIVAGKWWPTRTFYQSPFYAYFLALIYDVFGTGPWGPRVVQILLGSLAPVLLYAAGATLFSRRVGWLAGGALALYGPLVLEEVTLSKTSPLIVAALASFAVYVWAGPRLHLGGLAVAGFLLGLAVMGVAQWILAFFALAAYTWVLPAEAPIPERNGAVAVFAVAGLVAFAPVVYWNTTHGGGLILTSGGGGLNLYSGNNPRATGLPAAPRGVRDTPRFEEDDARRVAEADVGRALAPAEVDRYWSRQALTFVLSQPVDFLALLAKKVAVLWNAYEIPDNYHYAFMRRHFLPLLHVGVTFAVVAPLALVGLAIPFRRRGAVWALYIMCFAYVATLLAYYVRSRYRLAAVPFLILFAAVAAERLWLVVTERRWQSAAAWGGAVLIAALFVNHTYCDPAHDGMRAICLGGDAWFDLEWKRLAEWYQHRGDTERELAYVERAQECSSPRSPGDTSLWIGVLESRKVSRLLANGKHEEARTHFTRAERQFRTTITLNHRTALAHAELGTLYASMGMPAQAVEALESSRKSGGTDRKVLVQLARSYVDANRCADATQVLAGIDGSAGEKEEILARCPAK